METHTPWEIRLDSLTAEELAEYELLILPHLPHVSEGLAGRLREYARGGGKLVAFYRTSLLDGDGQATGNFALADLFGVDLTEESPYSIAYLDRLDDVFTPQVPDMPHVIKDTSSGTMNPENHALYCRLREGARALAWLTDPIIESNFETGHYVYHDHAPPGFGTEYPGLVLNSFGAGQVAYFPVPFLGGYARKSCPFLKALFRTLLNDVLGVPGNIRVEAPRSIKTALRHDEEGWLLHLIHIQKGTDDMYLDSFHRSDPVTVRVRPGWTVSCAADALSGEEFAVSEAQGWQEFIVPGVTGHRIVRIGA